MDQLKDLGSKGLVSVYTARADGETLSGFVSLGRRSNSISFCYAEGDKDLERKFLQFGFNELKQNGKAIKAGGPWITPQISEHLLDIGFNKYDRKAMTLEKDTVESMGIPPLSADIELHAYTEEMREEVVDLIYAANIGNIDIHVFPEFFSERDLVTKLVLDTENSRWGEWRDGISKVLTLDGKIIGVCFWTMQGTTGYIPEIAIHPDYKRKGLGRYILVASMKTLIEEAEDLTGFRLDVTLDNPARNLYESVGFNDHVHYSMYSWVP
jgi:ribosomal protein S18 acetylase RimI-like enzyme